MRVLVMVNPRATRARMARRRGALAALAAGLADPTDQLEVVETTKPGHARDLGSSAAADGLDVVVVVGGDGTVNEAVSGLLAVDVGSGRLPLLAPVPAGNANVFARALGLSRSPRAAVIEILAALRADRSRRVSLGRLRGTGPAGTADRWFTFAAGIGFDAEVIREVTRRRDGGARATSGLYLRAATRRVLDRSARADPAITIADGTGDQWLSPLHGVVVSNTTPWTYAGRVPLRPTPDASFGAGLDVFGMRRIDPLSTITQLVRIAAAPRHASPRLAITLHDVANLTVRATRAVDTHVDGEYLGLLESAEFASVAEALKVVDVR